MVTMLPALLLAAGAGPTAGSIDVDRTIAAIYQPYRGPETATAVWQRPIFSGEVRRLIRRWQRVVPEGEVDDLNDGDWLCLCQDWDNKRFRATIRSRSFVAPGLARVAVRIDLGIGEHRDARLMLRREGTRWLIDDLFATEYPRGLKQALRETIAADEKLKR